MSRLFVASILFNAAFAQFSYREMKHDPLGSIMNSLFGGGAGTNEPDVFVFDSPAMYERSAPMHGTVTFYTTEGVNDDELFAQFPTENGIVNLVDSAMRDMEKMLAIPFTDDLGQFVLRHQHHNKDGPCGCHCRDDVRKFCLKEAPKFTSHSKL